MNIQYKLLSFNDHIKQFKNSSARQEALLGYVSGAALKQLLNKHFKSGDTVREVGSDGHLEKYIDRYVGVKGIRASEFSHVTLTHSTQQDFDILSKKPAQKTTGIVANNVFTCLDPIAGKSMKDTYKTALLTLLLSLENKGTLIITTERPPDPRQFITNYFPELCFLPSKDSDNYRLVKKSDLTSLKYFIEELIPNMPPQFSQLFGSFVDIESRKVFLETIGAVLNNSPLIGDIDEIDELTSFICEIISTIKNEMPQLMPEKIKVPTELIGDVSIDKMFSFVLKTFQSTFDEAVKELPMYFNRTFETKTYTAFHNQPTAVQRSLVLEGVLFPRLHNKLGTLDVDHGIPQKKDFPFQEITTINIVVFKLKK